MISAAHERFLDLSEPKQQCWPLNLLMYPAVLMVSFGSKGTELIGDGPASRFLTDF